MNDSSRLLEAICVACSNKPELCSDPARILDDKALLKSAIDACGSWGNALRKAGLDAQFKASPEPVRLRRRRLAPAKRLVEWTRLHGPVSAEALRKTDEALLETILTEFGDLASLADELLGLPFVDFDDLLRCEVCGGYFKQLARHVSVTHNMTSDDYRERFDVRYMIPPSIRANLMRPDAWTEEEILDAIRDYAKQHWPLDRAWVHKRDRSLTDAAGWRFGNWANALDAAGLDGSAVRRKTDDDVLDEIREFVGAVSEDRYGDELTRIVVKKNAPALFGEAEKRFGTWYMALERLGIDTNSIRKRRRRLSRTDAAAKLKAWVKKNGPLSHAALKKNDAPLFNTIIWHYGTVYAAAEELGLPSERQIRKWDRETAIRELRAWCDEHGTLSRVRLRTSNSKLNVAVKRHLGKDLKAVAEELGLPFKAKCELGKWTPEAVCEALRRLHDQGVRLTFKNVAKHSDWGIPTAAIRLFGKWEYALQAAGLVGANKPKDNRFDPKLIKEEILAWMDTHGKLNATLMRKTNAPLHGRIKRKYGTFRAAAKALNIPYQYNQQTWSKSKIIKELNERFTAGEKITSSILRAQPGGAGLEAACRQFFGKLDSALRAAKLCQGKPRRK